MDLKDKYTIDFFLNDSDFREWVVGNRPAMDSYYDDFIRNNPDYSKIFHEAVFIVKTLHEDKRISTPYSRKVELWKQIRQRAHKKKKSIIPFRKFARYAALLLLLLSIGGSVYFFLGQDEYDKYMSEFPQEMPDETKLFLDQDREIEIASENSEITYKNNGAEVEVNGAEKYSQKQETVSKKLVYNQLTVPFGKKSMVVLADSTKVWLNAGSRLIYPTKFGAKNRTVFLKGEGFFEVTKNKEKPFWVQTELMKVRVLGTSFLIKAYPEEEQEEAIVATGVVSLEYRNKPLSPELEVYPNQRAVTSQKNTEFDVSEVRIKNYTSWIDDIFIFNNEPLSLVLEKVSKYYDIDLEWDKGIMQKKISGKLDLTNNYENVLNTLSLISNCEYGVNEEDKIYFKPH